MIVRTTRHISRIFTYTKKTKKKKKDHLEDRVISGVK